MKRFLMMLGFITIGSLAYGGIGASNTITVSSGTFLRVQGFGNNSGNFVQGITVADSSYTITAPVDPLNGLAVYITSGTGFVLPSSSTVSGTVTSNQGTPSNWAINAVQVNGTTMDTNSGTKSAGTQRVVIATDQPSLTNKLLVTPDSVALPANQSVNVAQMAGTTTDTNSGTKSAGTVRIVIATDQPALTNALKVDGSAVTQPISGTVTSNQGTAGTSRWGIDTTTGLYVVGGAAVGVTATGNPLRMGGDAHTVLPTAATDGQNQALMLDAQGRAVAILDCPRGLIGTSSQTITTNTTELVLISSGASAVFNDLTSVIAINTSATASRLDFRGGGGPSAGAISFALYIPAGETRGFMAPHVWPQSASASNWTVQGSASITDLRVYTTYCKNR